MAANAEETGRAWYRRITGTRGHHPCGMRELKMRNQIDRGQDLEKIDLPSFSFIDPKVYDEDHVTVMKHSCICNYFAWLLPNPR